MSDAAARTPTADFATLPDLASRRFGASVPAASDELFAERENLIKPDAPRHDEKTFGHRGQVYDGWETRRRREPGHDWALVRLGIPGVIRGVIVDTAYFTGNFPPEVSVEAAGVEGYPTPSELLDAEWFTIVERSPVRGDSLNEFEVSASTRFTHVRLMIYPDGGVARLRVHGEPVPDPRLLPRADLDLAALTNGAAITACSNMFYSSPANLLTPGPARDMGEGWETARRRDDGNDWVEVRLAGAGEIRQAEIDTSYFLGNAPGWAALSGYDARSAEPKRVELMPKTRLQPDIAQVFRLAPHPEITHVRVDVYPDGGFSRLRLHGSLSGDARDQLALGWFNRLPAPTAAGILKDSAGSQLSESDLTSLLAERPLTSIERLPSVLRQEFGCRPVSEDAS
jgi:allantoicase